MSIVRKYWLYFLLLIALFPFLDKAYHVDEPVFLRIADQILMTPTHPYDTVIEWCGKQVRIGQIIAGPPLHGFYLSLPRSFGPDAEWWLHLWMIPLSLLGLYATLRLGRGDQLVGALWLSAPCVLVSSTNLTPDVAVAALTTLGAALFVEGKFLGAAVILALASLERFNAAAALPALALHAIATRRWRGLLTLLVPCVAMGGWLAFSRETIGVVQSLGFHGHLLLKRIVATPVILLTAGIFPLALIAPGLRARELAVALGTGLVAFTLCERTDLGSYAGSRDIISVAVGATGFLITAHLARAIRVWRREGEALDITLWLWAVAALGIPLLYVNVSAKYLTVAAAPLALLASRTAVLPRKLLWGGAALWFALSCALNIADWELSNTYRQLAKSLIRPGMWFIGEFGFPYYAQRIGGSPIVEGRSPVAGDTILILREAGVFTQGLLISQVRDVRVLQSVTRDSRWPFRTMNFEAGAGFYAYSYGVLPWRVSRIPLEHATIVQVVHVQDRKP